MKRQHLEAAQSGVLTALGVALKAAPHPLLKAAAVLAAAGAHLKLSLMKDAEKTVEGTATRVKEQP